MLLLLRNIIEMANDRSIKGQSRPKNDNVTSTSFQKSNHKETSAATLSSIPDKKFKIQDKKTELPCTRYTVLSCALTQKSKSHSSRALTRQKDHGLAKVNQKTTSTQLGWWTATSAPLSLFAMIGMITASSSIQINPKSNRKTKKFPVALFSYRDTTKVKKSKHCPANPSGLRWP